MWDWEAKTLGYGIFVGVVIIGVMIYTFFRLRKQVREKKRSEENKKRKKE